MVLLRFFEGLDSAAIGVRLDLPASTVRAQVQQALTALRQRLDQQHGEQRAAWAAPLLGCCGASPTRALGVLFRITWPMRAAVGLVAAILCAWLAAPLWFGTPSAPPVPPIGTIEVATNNTDKHVTTPNVEPQRQSVASDIEKNARGPEDLWGRIVAAADGAPIAGAEVVLEHRDGDEMMGLDLEYNERSQVIGTVHTDANGGFAFAVQRALQHRIRVRAEGFATLRTQHCTGGSEFVLQLERPSFVEGVVRRKDGTPLEGVAVSAMERGGTGDRTVTKTAADGTFYLDGLAPKPTYVVAQPVGLRAPDWQRLDLEAGKGTRVEFEIEIGRTARGIVRDAATGQPVAGTRIDSSWTMRNAVTSGIDGTFALPGLGQRVTLRVQADGYAEQVKTVKLTEQDAQIEITLARGAVVSGRVVDSMGQPVPGAFVAAAVEQIWCSFWSMGTVAAGGRFRVSGLAIALDRGDGVHQVLPWQLVARAPGMGTRVLALPPDQLQGGFDVGDVVLLPQGLLEGRLLDSEGQLIVRAEVTVRGVDSDFDRLLPPSQSAQGACYYLSNRRTHTASDGTFRVAGLAAGDYKVFAEVDDDIAEVDHGPYPVRDGEVTVVPDLKVDFGLAIAGVVRTNGHPGLPPGGKLALTVSPNGSMQDSVVAPDGTFRIARLKAGLHVLYSSKPVGDFGVVPLRGVAAGARDVVIDLVPLSPIEGRVVDTDGKPAVGVYAYFFQEGVPNAKNHQTDEEGRFRIDVAAGVIGRLGARDPDSISRRVQQTNVIAGTRDIVLQLPK